MLKIENGRIQLDYISTNITDRCTMQCNLCVNRTPYLQTRGYEPPIAEFVQSCQHLARVLHSTHIEIAGGEAQLNPNFAAFARAIKQTDLASKNIFNTNGLLLPQLSDELWMLLDIIRILVYPSTKIRFTEEYLKPLRKKADQYGVDLQIIDQGWFQHRGLDEPNFDDNLVREIFLRCEEAHHPDWPCFSIENGRFYRCSRSGPIDRYLTTLGIPHAPFTIIDGLWLDDRPTLLDEVWNLLTEEKPREACRFCLGTSGKIAVHRQLTAAEISDRLNGKHNAQSTLTDLAIQLQVLG